MIQPTTIFSTLSLLILTPLEATGTYKMATDQTTLEKMLETVDRSAGSIQKLSFYCLHNKTEHKKIVQVWLDILKKSKVIHRLTLIYLANDIVQNAKRKGITSFIEDFKSVLKQTVPYIRDEKIKNSVERVFNIWMDRCIFDNEFLTTLKSLLNGGTQSSNKISKSVPNSTKIQDTIGTTTTTSSIATLTDDLLASLEKVQSFEKLTSKTIGEMKLEIEERYKLSIFLTESLKLEKKRLTECEEELGSFKQKLEKITQMRDRLMDVSS